jgi:hypothetical protein
MSPDHLVLREDPLTFEVPHLHKYSDDFMKFIGIDISLDSSFKVDGSSLNTKWSGLIVSRYTPYTKMPKVGQGNTSEHHGVINKAWGQLVF